MEIFSSHQRVCDSIELHTCCIETNLSHCFDSSFTSSSGLAEKTVEICENSPTRMKSFTLFITMRVFLQCSMPVKKMVQV